MLLGRDEKRGTEIGVRHETRNLQRATNSKVTSGCRKAFACASRRDNLPVEPDGTSRMSELVSNGSPRPVARVGHGDVWFPDGLTEVVAHTDGRFLSVTLTALSTDIGRVWVEEFECAKRDACLAQLREWLGRLGAIGNAHAALHVAKWAGEVSERIIAALYRH
jgi:hypothetical protein